MSSPNSPSLPAAQGMWLKKKCLLIFVGSAETVAILAWKGPAASFLYLLLVFWSFLIYEAAVFAQISVSKRIVVRSRLNSIGSANQFLGPLISNSNQPQQVQRGDRTLATTNIARGTSIASQELPQPKQEHLATNNTIASENATADVSPSASSSTSATRCSTAVSEAPESEAPHAETLTEQTRRMALKRPLTPIKIMKPSESALERYVSPRRPLAPVNMQQRLTDRSSTNPATASTGEINRMLRMGTVPKPWPKSMSRVDKSSTHRQSFSAAPFHPHANCSRSQHGPLSINS